MPILSFEDESQLCHPIASDAFKREESSRSHDINKKIKEAFIKKLV